MKLSCLPVSFFAEITAGKLTVADWARMGASLKLDAVDLSILFLREQTLKAAEAVRRQVEDAGMSIAMLTTYPDFTHPDPKQRSKELELEIEAVGLAAALGARIVRVTDGQAHPETSVQEGIEWAVLGLTSLVEAAGTWASNWPLRITPSQALGYTRIFPRTRRSSWRSLTGSPRPCWVSILTRATLPPSPLTRSPF